MQNDGSCGKIRKSYKAVYAFIEYEILQTDENEVRRAREPFSLAADKKMITDSLRRFLEENSLPEQLPSPEAMSGEGEASQDTGAYLNFLYLTMPYADVGGYAPTFFMNFARHGAFLRETTACCREIPENIFLWYVLHPRVNNEELSDCRRLFYDSLSARVEGLPPAEAVLEVNRWCAEHVTYRSTDDRTASALSVYRTGYGRCGEESVFAVNALRSVGIPARQIYAPWWSHCDDNHAWVEVWINGQWRFLGACEPEPVLDRGWFTEASSRAMLVHAKRFCRLPAERIRPLLEPEEERDRVTDGCVLHSNVTARYAETDAVSVRVRDGGRPAPFARVSLQVLNMASFCNLITFCCDEEGNAEITLGRGSLRVCAFHEGRQSAVLADTGECREITLDLRQEYRAPIGDFRMRAPLESLKNVTALTAGQKKSRNIILEQAAKRRASRKNNLAVPEGLERIARTLPQKDRDDIPVDILSRHQAFVERFEKDYPAEIFEKYLLCPRIGLEPLSVYTEAIDRYFSQEQKERFHADPETIRHWIDENISEIGADLSFLPSKPEAVFKTGFGTAADCLVLFVAIARSCGVPAYLDGGFVFYYQQGAFRPAGGTEAGAAEIVPGDLSKDILAATSVCRAGALQELPVPGWSAGERIFVPAGEYRLTAVSRLPKGDLVANSSWISCMAGQRIPLRPELPSVRPEDMLQKLPLEAFPLQREGEAVVSCELIRQGKRIFLWLEPAKEPTEHILNELLERADAYRGMASKLCLILENRERQSNPLLGRVIHELGVPSLYFEDDTEDKVLIARRLYLDPERLPLILLIDESHDVLYAAGGYNVGTADLLLKVGAAASLFDKESGTV